MSHREENVEISVDEEFIDGTLLTPDPSAAAAPGVLFLHGWGGSQEQYLGRARAVASLGCVCLVVDLRGHVSSEWRREVVSREDNLCDCLAAYDRLIAAPGVDPSAVGVVGSSYGGYLAAILTSLRAVRWLGLRAPALYEDDGWSLPKRWLYLFTVALTYNLPFPEQSLAGTVQFVPVRGRMPKPWRAGAKKEKGSGAVVSARRRAGRGGSRRGRTVELPEALPALLPSRRIQLRDGAAG